MALCFKKSGMMDTCTVYLEPVFFLKYETVSTNLLKNLLHLLEGVS